MTSTLNLNPLYAPRAIAVVGATETTGAVGCEIIQNLLRHGYDGTIFPVNPKYDTLYERSCFASLADLPYAPDLVAIAVPAVTVADIVRKAGALGVSFAIVYASGFAEAGEEGAALQEDVARAAAETGIRVIGPNCQGVMNIADGIHIGFGPPYGLSYRKGAVSVVSQSGAFGNSLLIGMDAEGLGLCRYASTGNEVQTGLTDLIGGLLEDDATQVIAGYIEGMSDGTELRRLALRAVETRKPLVLWKVGTSQAGARAAASHTANLAGDPACYQAVFDQLGIIRATDVDDMADAVRALQNGRYASGKRVGVVTVSGGAGVAMADRADDLGLTLDAFTPATLDRLTRSLPKFASFANPLDVTAGVLASPEWLAEALRAVVEDPNVDMLAVALAAVSGRAAMTAAETLAAIAAETGIPIVIAWNAPVALNRDASDILERANLPVFQTPGRAIRGLAAAQRFGAAIVAQPALERLAAGPFSLPKDTQLLDEMASKAYLPVGISAPQEDVARTADEALAIARRIGGRVVMKLLSASVAHKSDIGGVRVNLSSDAEITAAFDDISTIAAGLTPAGSVLVQAMVVGGTETIIGARIDEVFGPMVMFGAGGIYAELMQDVSFRMAPFGLDEAHRMISETRFSRVLAGARGREAVDIDALAVALVGMSEAIAADGSLQEIEINPLFVLPKGKGVIVGDCVVHLAQAPDCTQLAGVAAQ
ncbi:acetate--CoA ligase family protein [uncultured Paracoccus sp.]|uniref:acetate--CoA ligase family protein n=1 Tax=uncultured Paracoccus sp. TaxID=189685 RepID=UPI00261FFDA8|nr:acetate--CoA ligase family protein [uncultured Paracoccus sp.]